MRDPLTPKKTMSIFGRDIEVNWKLYYGYVKAMDEIDEKEAISELASVLEDEHPELRTASEFDIKEMAEDYLKVSAKVASAPENKEFLDSYIEELNAEGNI